MTRGRCAGWVLATVLAGCGGSGDGGASRSGAGGGGQTPLHFTVRTGTGGSTSYPCASGSGAMTQGVPSGFMISCQETNASGEYVTDAVLALAGYHGTGTYPFTGSVTSGASAVQFTLDNYDYLTSVGATPGEPTPSCTVQITSGSATPALGDPVSGTFHCDVIVGSVVGDAAYYPPVFTTADGEFDGAVVF
jgi:hypothetical protein